ncbi:MAG: maleylpyruvate isomerase family mycothiol-dependent enzyme, partial [Pseudomonadota bacterium]
WVGPEMSARSAMTARQMETWAHGLAIWDLVGKARPEADRLRNIVHLGVSTFAWSHQVQGLETPEAMPNLHLTAPSGALWEYGAPSAAERIEGPAVAFAMVVTQTRNVADTGLRLTGPGATLWMTHAQCFAGPRETPPAPGIRGLGAGAPPPA